MRLARARVGGGDSDPTLAGQARVHGLVVAAAAVEPGQDRGRDDDVRRLGQRRRQGGPDGALVRLASSQG